MTKNGNGVGDYVVGFGPRSEFLRLKETTKVRDMRLDDVRRLQLKEFAVFVTLVLSTRFL
jgi:hypothetical protein